MHYSGVTPKLSLRLGQIPTCQGRGKQLLVRRVGREDGLVVVALGTGPQHERVVFDGQEVGPVVAGDTHQGTHHSLLAANLKTRKCWKILLQFQKNGKNKNF